MKIRLILFFINKIKVWTYCEGKLTCDTDEPIARNHTRFTRRCCYYSGLFLLRFPRRERDRCVVRGKQKASSKKKSVQNYLN